MPVNERLPAFEKVNAGELFLKRPNLGWLKAGHCYRGHAIHGVLRMKSRESLTRLKEFQLKEKRRQLKQLQMMMAEFERMAKDLENQIQYEEKKSGITDPSHFAYSTFAKAARQRSDNLQVSIKELKAQQDTAEASVEELQEEFDKASAIEERDLRLRA
jgi:hypothetical protein